MPSALTPACSLRSPLFRRGLIVRAVAMSSGKRTIASFFAPRSPQKKAKQVEDSAKACAIASDDGESTPARKSTIPCNGVSNLSVAQQLKISASKNMAVSKMAVKKAQHDGRQPQLKELLADAAWQEGIGAEFAKPYISQLEKFVHQEWAGHQPVYPPKELVFRAYNTVPFDKIKVVILGQDPYHGPGQAEGLCFSVPRDQKRPSSLLNIYKELASDCGCRIASHGNLESWASQGVFMLNTVLTVRAHQANSHARKGWEVFTDATIQHISRQREGVVFLLWGKQAQDKERLLDSKKHHILKSAHPSGLSAHRGFFGCKHFSQANEVLKQQGLEPINWQV